VNQRICNIRVEKKFQIRILLDYKLEEKLQLRKNKQAALNESSVMQK